jgi:hypothetical protein
MTTSHGILFNDNVLSNTIEFMIHDNYSMLTTPQQRKDKKHSFLVFS